MPRRGNLLLAFALLGGCGDTNAGTGSTSPFSMTTTTISSGANSDVSSEGTGSTGAGTAASSTRGGTGMTADPTMSTGAVTEGSGDEGPPSSDVPALGPVLPGEIRYMMAGDSITDWGHLWRSGVVTGLMAEGLLVETVGPYTDEAEHQHAGLASQQTSFILQNMPTWVDEHSPNVVNLLIGVNDIRGNVPTDTIVSNMTSIVQTIRDAEPDCFVFVNSVMRYQGSFGGDPNRVPEINAGYEQVVESFAAEGMPIYWVDLYSVVPADEIGDGLHPSVDQAGATLMTDAVLGVMSPLVP